MLLLLALSAACKRQSMAHHDYMYVSAAETSLRDRVATMYNKVGTVHNGDRVEVLEKQRRFLRVRTDNGQQGWIEERSLCRKEIFDGFPEAGAGQCQHASAGTWYDARRTNMHLARRATPTTSISSRMARRWRS